MTRLRTPGRTAASVAPTRREPRTPVAALVSAVALLGAFAVFTLLNEPGGGGAVDREVARLTVRLVRGPLHPLVDRIALFGSPTVSMALTALLVAVLLVRRRWLAAVLVIGAVAGMTAIEVLLRVRVEALPWRDLPDLLLHPRGRHLLDSSYPSGHAARLMLLTCLTAVLLPRRLVGGGLLVACALGALIAVQRVHERSHTGSDVVGGLLLGGGTAALFASFLPWAGAIEGRAGRAPPGRDGP